VDENPRIAQRFGITGIPALYVFKGGRIVERLAGAQPAPVLRQALARHVGGGDTLIMVTCMSIGIRDARDCR
jgi:thioredoxin-like negative regulator of GroEL